MHDAKRRQPALSCVWLGNISIYSETQMPYGYCSHADVWHPSCLWTFQNSLKTLSLIFPHLPSSSGPSLSHDALLADSLMPSSWQVLGRDACPLAVFSGWTLTYSSWLNLGLSALEGIYNKALPPCRDERDTGESINFQTCRVKGCLSSQQDTFKLRYNLRTKTKVAAWPSCVCYDLWLAMSPLQVLAFPHIFQVKGSKMCMFSHVRLFANLWTVAARLLCPWDFPGKNTGMGHYFHLQGVFLTQDQTHISCASCIAAGFCPNIWAPWPRQVDTSN